MEDNSNSFMMIGLHKLAAERGDGLIPELLALYSVRQQLAENEPMALDLPAKIADDVSMKSAGNDNVIPFRPYLLAKKKR